MYEIKQAVRRQRDRHQPQVEPEAQERDAGESAHHEALDDQRARRAAHRREQHVVGGDDDHHDRVERPIPIEPNPGGKDGYTESENQADCVRHRYSSK